MAGNYVAAISGLFLALFVSAARTEEPTPSAARARGSALYAQIIALDRAEESDRGLAAIRGDYAGAVLGSASSPERFKMVGDLTGRLRSQAHAGDSESAFYWGYYQMGMGDKFAAAASKSTAGSPGASSFMDSAEKAYGDAIVSLQVASKAGIGAASWNIAAMYEVGAGVTKSKLAAAEWYARAGEQHLWAGDRERALAALERIEEVDPKHPDAIKLRAMLFSVPKKR